MSGMLTYSDFEAQATAFAAASQHTDQKWEWVPSPPKDVRFIHGGGGFLKLAGQKKQLPKREGFPQPNTVGSNSIESEESEDEDLIISESLQDPSALPREADSEEFTVFEYHVVFSSTYEVPVLLLRGCTAAGALLSPEAVWAQFAFASSRSAEALPTPDEHPVTGEPFLGLHPCRTREFMDMVAAMRAKRSAVQQDRQENWEFLACWLSVFGGVVGLRVPLALFQASGASG